jgi:hypothetical protein
MFLHASTVMRIRLYVMSSFRIKRPVCDDALSGLGDSGFVVVRCLQSMTLSIMTKLYNGWWVFQAHLPSYKQKNTIKIQDMWQFACNNLWLLSLPEELIFIVIYNNNITLDMHIMVFILIIYNVFACLHYALLANYWNTRKL